MVISLKQIVRQTISLCTYVNRCIISTVYVAPGCYMPEWEVIEDQNSVGATQYSAAQSVQECLDHCGSQDNCLAVDVDLSKEPPTCWPHFSADYKLERNVYSAPGTNQYRLTNRCASGPIRGFYFNIISFSFRHGVMSSFHHFLNVSVYYR